MIKRNFALKLISCIVIVAALFYYNQMMKLNGELVEANTKMEQMAGTTASDKAVSQNPKTDLKFKDGTYSGTAQGYGGPVTTQIVISGGCIAGIEITSAPREDAAYYNMCLVILDEIAASQSADVDTVSGATYTSNGIINGAKDALDQAKK